MSNKINDLHDWLQTPVGQVLMHWEQACLDELVVDLFGFHALQLGLLELNALQANRIPNAWRAWLQLPARPDDEAWLQQADLVAASEALPFAEASLDLVVMPHTLAFSHDPHASLREVHRVLVHEGHVVIAGLNPVSLWGWRHLCDRIWRRLGRKRSYLPPDAQFIRPGRLRDWLKLLDFEVLETRMGCYRAAMRSSRVLKRFAWMERYGQRFWPLLGAAYCIVAVKRTHGMHLLGATWQNQKVKQPAAVGVPSAGVQKNSSQIERIIEKS